MKRDPLMVKTRVKLSEQRFSNVTKAYDVNFTMSASTKPAPPFL